MSSTPAPLFEHSFGTARPSRPIFCHQEVLDKLAARRNDPVAKRVSLLLQRMAVDIARLHYKGTGGINRGWRRSRLGGGSGSHFYAWWAPFGAAPVKGEASFDAAPNDAVFFRDIRHHDDHTPLGCGALSSDYLPLNVSDLRAAEYAPEPWTAPQSRFARSHSLARILKGHPGSGKTTALLHAADASHAERVLYLTFSQDLAVLARDYFDRFCSNSRIFTVSTYATFLIQILGTQASTQERDQDPVAMRTRFRRDFQHYQRSAGVWSSDPDALYDEIHAHIVGAALPEPCGRFIKAERICLPEKAYLAQRERYLGPAANSVIEAVRRLERSEEPLADRYYPDLALAWRASQSIARCKDEELAAFRDVGCIAVDEVQDLTPLEFFVVLKLTQRLNARGGRVPLLLAGDEAQTVRATDFEWAWLNDMLHGALGQPQEFKTQVNLRSPRRIADLVNRVWDFYDYLHKQDRPSGNSYAEIDDDSPDEILYATAPASELLALVQELSQREGLALIAFDKSALPEQTQRVVLSPAEAKGLDFHSVCVLNGGALVRRVVDERAAGPAQALNKRLAIDQLRVALSRPGERLLWLDIAPDAGTVKEVSRLLRPAGESYLPPITVEALRTCLAEEELDVEERVQRCQRDARQFTAVKPDLAWSRAQQAVALLGFAGDGGGVTDPAAREAAYMTLAEVCFQLGFRKQNLSPELGRPDLYEEAAKAALGARKFRLANAIRAIGAIPPGHGAERLNMIAAAIQHVAEAHEELPSWLIVEIAAHARFWLEELDRNLDAGDNPILAQKILPPFFDALRMPDAQARKERLAERALQILMRNRRYAQALTILERLPTARPKLMAECYEELGELRKAAAIYLEIEDREKALRCYRSIPDFAAALRLVQKLENHPARAPLEWLQELDSLLGRRPENFNRAMTAPEKNLLAAMLERGLGVQRKKPTAKKAVANASSPDKPPKRPRGPRKSPRRGMQD